ncbi:O-methyltransferase [Amycolatopsis endophytica]|uniref:Putative O-methyltransferase YrrM n=1 Tax=Amycolatopsis endophytica TaxID=860233 RepID=A0A853B4D3_9PSEU|nr:O-methyltransferase [Amycolatopsis endophytica]NYI90053.1 putative O-methyltransferase YrrM [Amycolatopsis endophytica]
MNQRVWNEVDEYVAGTLIPADPVLEDVLAAIDHAGLPPISVSPAQGKLLHLLARIHGARSILEIGTLGGYSTIWLARALPADGRLVTLEADLAHAQVAENNLDAAGFGEIVEIRVGPALDTLPSLAGPFDFVFVDADKVNNPSYFEWALRLSRPGTMIVVDNVVRNGAIADASSTDPAVVGTRKMHDLIAAEARVEATTVQTVGSKGYDGFTLVLVTS